MITIIQTHYITVIFQGDIYKIYKFIFINIYKNWKIHKQTQIVTINIYTHEESGSYWKYIYVVFIADEIKV